LDFGFYKPLFKKIINNKSKTITSAAVILGAASVISRFLGLARDRLLAGRFGAGDELDVYYAAFRIPDLVYSLLVLGAVSAGFIPVFTGYLKKSKEEELKDAWYLANSVLNIVILMVMAVCLVLIIWAPFLVKLVAPGFSPDKIAMTVDLTRIMFLSPLILGISAIFSSILQSLQRFFVYSLAPIMYNLGIIFGIVVLVDYWGLLGLAWGVVLGALLHLLIQLPTVFICGFRWRPVFDFKFEGVKRVFKMMPPRVLTSVLFQVNFWVMTVLASFLAVGSVAVYNLSQNIWGFPLGVFGVSFMLAAFPKLSEYAQSRKLIKFEETFFRTASQVLFFTLPVTALFIALKSQVVRVILGTGNFNKQDVFLTSETLMFFSFSIFAEALILLLMRGFFAFENSRTPFLIGLLATAIRISSAWYLSRFMGISGLALGFSLGALVYLVLLYILFYKKILKTISKRQLKFLKTSFKILTASFFAGIISYLLLNPLSFYFNIDTLSGAFFQGLLSGLAGIVVYLGLTRFLAVEELSLLKYRLFFWK
jgi:putative peptidoglycan lipid II flippase